MFWANGEIPAKEKTRVVCFKTTNKLFKKFNMSLRRRKVDLQKGSLISGFQDDNQCWRSALQK